MTAETPKAQQQHQGRGFKGARAAHRCCAARDSCSSTASSAASSSCASMPRWRRLKRIDAAFLPLPSAGATCAGARRQPSLSPYSATLSASRASSACPQRVQRDVQCA